MKLLDNWRKKKENRRTETKQKIKQRAEDEDRWRSNAEPLTRQTTEKNRAQQKPFTTIKYNDIIT